MYQVLISYRYHMLPGEY